MAKQTFDEMWNTEFFQRHAKGAIAEATRDFEEKLVSAFTNIVEECESPLEAAFAAWWTALTFLGAPIFALDHQEEVEVCGQRYRLDLVVEANIYGYFGRTDRAKRPRIAIELDGHEFHERSKEQVTRRNRRDRDLISAGWVVWHVSGSEFHADPFKVVSDVQRRCVEMYRKVFGDRV